MDKKKYTLDEYYQIYLIRCLFTDFDDNCNYGILSFEEFKKLEGLSINVKYGKISPE